MALDFATRSYF